MTFEAQLLPAFDGGRLVRVPLAALDQARLPGWDLLHPEERAWLKDRPARRLRELVAARAALRTALLQVGWAGDRPLLALPRGGPELPDGFTGSISHKAGQALAVAAPRDGRTLGVDTEVLGDRDRSSIAQRVLRPEELARWRVGGEDWAQLLRVFSIKEAVYKALHPWVRRYVGFDEAEVTGDVVRLHLEGGEGPFTLRSSTTWEGDRVITVVEVRATSPGAAAPTP